MILLDHAPYTPFDTARTRHPPGLSPMDPADWIVVHDDYAAQMAYRTDLLAHQAETVLACQPTARAAMAELYDAVLAHLTARPDFQVTDTIVTRPDGVCVTLDPARPLTSLGHLTAEDWCLMLPPTAHRTADESTHEITDEYVLGAAVLCFPSHWLLSEKIGHPLTVIHEPVDDYDDTLARRVNRVFAAIRPGHPMVRCNWLVHPSAELFRPMGRAEKEARREDPPTALYLRTERQTLVRLPETKAVVFGIKTSVCPLTALTQAQSAALHDALAQKNEDAYFYRAQSPVLTRAREILLAQAG